MQLYSAQFSQCGRFLATVCKDGRIRIYDPRAGAEPVVEGAEIVPKKGARIVWALDGKFLIVTGFSRQSQRQVIMISVILIYDLKDPGGCSIKIGFLGRPLNCPSQKDNSIENLSEA